MKRTIKTPKGFRYVCECGFEKRLQSKYRAIPCPNCCEGNMKLKQGDKGEVN